MLEVIGTEACAVAGVEAAAEVWDGADERPGAELGLGLPFEAFLNPVELELAHKVVAGLEPGDPQEEIHAWHLAVSHLLAAQRIGKSRQEGLSERAEQIEVGLAVRIMTLADRKSAALDRHRDFRRKAAREAAEEAEEIAEQAALARPTEHPYAGFLVTPDAQSPLEWQRLVAPEQQRREAGEPEPEGYPEARELLWQERCAYLMREARKRGQSKGMLSAPYPTEGEVAARVDADRRRKQPADVR